MKKMDKMGLHSLGTIKSAGSFQTLREPNPQLLGVAFRANLARGGDFLHQAISAVIWCTVHVKSA
jgi:hypothetical protein